MYVPLPIGWACERSAGDKTFKTSHRLGGQTALMTADMRPRLVVADPDRAIDFYLSALGAELRHKFVDGDGVVVHAELALGDAVFSLAQEVEEWGLLSPFTLGGSASLITLEVEDAPLAGERMVAHGATVVIPIEDRGYGRCEGRVRDPSGHLWIPSHATDPTVSYVDARPTNDMPPVRRIVPDLATADPQLAAGFYQRLLGLEVLMDLGSVMTLGVPDHPETQLTLLTSDASAATVPQLSVEVDDLDGAWETALENGFEIVHDRAVEPWGVERFFVRDPDGNTVNVLRHADGA